MSLIKGKDIVDQSVSRNKLDFEIKDANLIIKVSGDVSSSDNTIQLPIEDTGFILQLQYQSSNIAYLYGITDGSDIVADVRRSSIYGDASQGKTFNGFTWTNTIQSSQLIDDILMDSTDNVSILIRINNILYNAFVWISGSGQRADMWYYKIG